MLFRLSLFLLVVLSSITTGCRKLSHDLAQPLSKTPPVDASDSLRMISKFENLLRIPNKTDSILSRANILLEEKPELEDTYNLAYGRYLILTGQLEAARNQVESVISQFENDTLNEKLAKYHNLMGAVEAYTKSHEASINHFKQAIRIFQHHDNEREASVIKFNLANIFFGRLDYESAYRYGTDALSALEREKDTTNIILCLAVLAAAEVNLEKVKEAEIHAQRALLLSEKNENLQAQLLANYAMGEVELASDHYAQAIQRFEKAIALGEEHHMLQWLLPIRAALLKTYLVKGNNQQAVAIGKKLVEQAAHFGNRDIMYSAVKNLATAQGNLGMYSEAYTNMEKAEKLFREHMSETSERVLRETMVKYETEKKNNIILQQENQISKQQIATMWLSGIALLVIIGLFLIWEYTRQKNKILQKEKENAVFFATLDGEEKERNRLAGELHDGIASNLVAIKLNLENRKTNNTDTDKVLNLIAKTHQEIRQAAHNLAPLYFKEQNLATALKTFASECTHPDCTVTFSANKEAVTKHLPKNLSLIMYRSVQELTQNALKHAGATSVSIQMNLINQELQITVSDDGKGFDPNSLQDKPTSGIENLTNRLQKIGGVLDIDSQSDSGTSIFINLKIAELT